MSRRGCDGGRKKGVIDSRRGVNCPVSDCDVSGRIDYVKKHFNKLIVWSKTHESEAAEESEIDFKNASKDAKQHTKWCRRHGYTKSRLPFFKDLDAPVNSVINFFSKSNLNNNDKPVDKRDSLTQQQKCSICPTTTHYCKVCSKSVCNLCSFGSREHDKIRVHKTCLPKTDANLYMVDQQQSFVQRFIPG